MFQYPIRQHIARSREVLKLWDLFLKLSDCCEIWQAHWQHRCPGVCRISERCDHLNYQSHSFETSQNLTIASIIGHWNGVLVPDVIRAWQSLYWLCRIKGFMSSIRKVFNHLHHFFVQIWWKCNYIWTIFLCLLKKALKQLTIYLFYLI